ncbi:MAG TPA: hypothetical protein VJA21_25740, partial [Verrucomicrobiae bacterium]
QPALAQPTPAPESTVASVPPYVAAPAVPAPVYVQPEPEPPPSTVYVIPYPAATSAYYGYYAPYYGGYYGGYYAPYCGPTISLGFRFGGFGYHHGFYGHRRHW